MNTKIITALVIAFALVGLTGAASAAVQTDEIYYDYLQTFAGEEINPVDIISGAGFQVYDAHFDSTVGPCDKCAIVGNYMATYPDQSHGGAYDHTITQSGYAGMTMRTVDDEDVLPELELSLKKAQTIAYSGQFDSYGVDMASLGIIGENYGVCGVGDDDPVCCNCHLIETAVGSGDTWTTEPASLTEGTFAMASHQSMDVYLANENTVMDLKGGVVIGSTFDGNVDFGGSIATNVWAQETSSVSAGMGACGSGILGDLNFP